MLFICIAYLFFCCILTEKLCSWIKNYFGFQAGGEDLREKKSNLRNIESQNVTTTNIAPAASTVTDIYMEGEEIDVIKPVTDSHLNNKRHYLDELFVKTIHEKKIRKGSAINSDDRYLRDYFNLIIQTEYILPKFRSK